MSHARRFRFTQLIEALESRKLLSSDPTASLLDTIHASTNLTLTPAASSSSVIGLSPSQVAKAYGYNSISFKGVKGDGSGQTIAIVGAYDAPTILSDLKTFDKQFSLTDPSFKKENQNGSTSSLPKPDAGWSLELSLDVEWSHAMAPKAHILLVEASSDSLGDLLKAVDTARSASGVSVVSMSWGADEFWGQTSYDYHFTTPSGHQGVTFVAASGDDGSFYGAEWPATSPGVLSVGGTSLSLTSSGSYSRETGWSGSGGGFSELENEPAYQNSVQDTGVRTSPDVSFDANPNTGFAVYDSTSYQGYRGWGEVGGTSAGTPQWAALVAIANQGRALAGKSSLNGLTQTLPTLYSTANHSSTYSADFHDITNGRTSFFISAFGGYDLVSGLGSPKANAVAQLLKNAGTSASSSVKLAASTTVKTTVTKSAVALTNSDSPVVPLSKPTPALRLDHETILSATQAQGNGPLKETAVRDLSDGITAGTALSAARFGQRAIAESSLGGGAAPIAAKSPVHTDQGPTIETVEISLPPEMFEADARASIASQTQHPTSNHASPHYATAGINLTTPNDGGTSSRTGMVALATAVATALVTQWCRLRKRGKIGAVPLALWKE